MDKTNVKALVIAPPGCGKTHFCGTFPKSYWISTEPDGYETIEMKKELRKNTVKQQNFIPEPMLVGDKLVPNVKQTFIEISKACIEAHQMQKEGQIETLVLDNITYLSENRWIYVNQHEKEISKSGETDVRAMYGKLGRWLYEFVLMNFCSFKGNVVVTAHIKQEHEEALKRKVGNDDEVADILGGFRNQAPGMFSIVAFLDKLKTDKGYRYIARLDKSNDKLAKNRYGLPEVMDNVSYQTIYDAIQKAKQ